MTYSSSIQLVSAGTGRTLARYPLEGLRPRKHPVAGRLPGGRWRFGRAGRLRSGQWPANPYPGYPGGIRTLSAPGLVACERPGSCRVLRSEAETCRTRTSPSPPTADKRRTRMAFRRTGREIRLATGSVAYQQAGFSYPGPLRHQFAQVGAAGRLLPLTVPAEGGAGRWELAAVERQRAGVRPAQRAAERSGRTAVGGLESADRDLHHPAQRRRRSGPVALGHTSWQQYSPSTLP